MLWYVSSSLQRIALQACSFIRLRSRLNRASYGEMSRRSDAAAEADNHSDISPLRIKTSGRSTPALSDAREEPRVNRSSCDSMVYEGSSGIIVGNCVRPLNVDRSVTAFASVRLMALGEGGVHEFEPASPGRAGELAWCSSFQALSGGWRAVSQFFGLTRCPLCH
jgi:hypothetical protein